jgi:NAD(P)-dependent dehydrogenase (short-subunit alcohol dehydrogenase family)
VVDRIVLVTGGSGGIGRAVAARFRDGGDTVIITGRDPGRLAEAAAQTGARGVACDASDPGQVAALAGEVGPHLDVLVNAAGGNTDFTRPGPAPAAGGGAGAEGAAGPDGPPLAEVMAAWRANLDANLLSAVLTTTAMLGKLRPGGSVISISSIGAEYAATSYGAAKAALAAWNAGLSAQAGAAGLTANVISPGYIAGTGFFHGRLTGERRSALIAATHTKRPGHPRDIAETAWFLASGGARHITGQTLHVNGGAHTTR